MSLLNKVLNLFGLGEKEVQEPTISVSHQHVTPKVVIKPIVESQETPVEAEIKIEEPVAPAKPKTAPKGRPKSSTAKKSAGTKKTSTGTRKPRTPRKPKEE
jgi:hypothetical protein